MEIVGEPGDRRAAGRFDGLPPRFSPRRHGVSWCTSPPAPVRMRGFSGGTAQGTFLAARPNNRAVSERWPFRPTGQRAALVASGHWRTQTGDIWTWDTARAQQHSRDVRSSPGRVPGLVARRKPDRLRAPIARVPGICIGSSPTSRRRTSFCRSRLRTRPPPACRRTDAFPCTRRPILKRRTTSGFCRTLVGRGRSTSRRRF